MKPWLAHYDADVKPTLEPYPNNTLIDYLARLAREHGKRTALLFKGATVTYRQLEDESDAFAAALVALGVRKGDRVAVLLPNCPQFLIAEFGVWKAGAIVVALNPTYSERELEQALDTTRVETVVDAHAVLRARQARPGAHRRPPHHRHVDQGVPADAAAGALHAVQGEERGPSHHAAAAATRGCRTCCANTAAHRDRL